MTEVHPVGTVLDKARPTPRELAAERRGRLHINRWRMVMDFRSARRVDVSDRPEKPVIARQRFFDPRIVHYPAQGQFLQNATRKIAFYSVILRILRLSAGENPVNFGFYGRE